MRRVMPAEVETARAKHPYLGWGRDWNGYFRFRSPEAPSDVLNVIASDGDGWDHVSVSLPTRCPSWEEMAFVKRLFFGEDEPAIQIYPPQSQYVNRHPYCLHWWRKQGFELPLPPMEFVG